jgi:hypothetical protein
MINESWLVYDVEGGGCGLIWGIIPAIARRDWENHKKSQDSRCLGWGSNHVSPVYKSGAFVLESTFSFSWSCKQNLSCASSQKFRTYSLFPIPNGLQDHRNLLYLNILRITINVNDTKHVVSRCVIFSFRPLARPVWDVRITETWYHCCLFVRLGQDVCTLGVISKAIKWAVLISTAGNV